MRASIAASALVCLLLIHGSEAREIESARYGNWQLTAYVDDTTNSFNSCSITTGFASGATLVISRTVSGLTTLGVAHPNFNLTPRAPVSGSLKIDDRYFTSFTGRALDATMYAMAFEAGDPIFEHLRRGRQLTASVSALGELPFDLTDTARALDMVRDCVERHRAQVRVDPRAALWLTLNPWFNAPEHRNETAIASGISAQLVRDGIGLDHPAHFAELHKRLIAAGVTIAKPLPGETAPATAQAAAPVEQTPPPAAAAEPQYRWAGGTGFVVSANGHILTNYHVLDGCVAPVIVQAPNGMRYEAAALAGDSVNDIALVQSDFRSTVVAVMRDSGLRTGEPITVAGFPLQGMLATDLIVTNGIVNAMGGMGDDTRFVQISAPVQPGNSGGPLLDERGNVAGIVSAGVDDLAVAKQTGAIPQNINFAIKSSLVRDFLEKNRVGARFAQTGPVLSTVQIADRAREFTVQLACRVPVEAEKK